MKHITIRLFGAYRPFGSEIVVVGADTACVGDLREALLAALPGVKPALVESTRFATEETLLPDDVVLEDGAIVAVIPPVSGG